MPLTDAGRTRDQTWVCMLLDGCRAVIVLEDIDTVGLESRGRSKGDKAGGAEDGKAREPAAPPAQVGPHMGSQALQAPVGVS